MNNRDGNANRIVRDVHHGFLERQARKLLTTLLHIRNTGVPMYGICASVGEGSGLLRMLLVERYGQMGYVLDLGDGTDREVQYDRTVWKPQDNHDYLCLRWELLNYLINETEDIING